MIKDPILSETEAKRLLEMIKKSYEDFVDFPSPGKKFEFDAEGDSKKDIFSVNIYRSKINIEKYTYGIRVKKNGVFLLGLDVGKTLKHRNPLPDGKLIVGSHWHIYTEKYQRQFALPAENIETDNFVENTLLFFKKIHLIPIPEVSYQNILPFD